MTDVRHGPLWGDRGDAASGWVRITCDCGWRGTVVPATLYAIEEYGDHRQAAERERLQVELKTYRDTIDRMDRVHRDQMRQWAVATESLAPVADTHSLRAVAESEDPRFGPET